MSLSRWMELPHILLWLHSIMTGPDVYQGCRTRGVLVQRVDERDLVAHRLACIREAVGI